MRFGLSDEDDLFAELDLDRVVYSLRYVEELEHRARHPETVELAVWLAGAPRLPAGVGEDIRRLVDVLGHHDPEPDDDDGQVVSDADLAILSAPAGEYRRYCEELRVDPDIRLGEVNVLLGRDSIYRTPEMRAGREARAQLNLARERAALLSTVSSAKSPQGRDEVR